MKIAIIGGLILALLGGTGLIDSLSVLGDSVGLDTHRNKWGKKYN